MGRAAKHRLFLALRPDPAAAEAVGRLTRRLELLGPAMPAARLHVSLAFVWGGETPPPSRVVMAALKASQGLDAPPFRVAFNRLLSWKRADPEQRPLVLTGDEGVIGIDGLRGRLEARLAQAGLVGRDRRERWAHMTVHWGRHAIDKRLAEPIGWTVHEALLLDSVYGEGRQVLLGRVPLRPARPPAPPAARPDLRRSAAR
jgi:2'-5' RNA ligase